MADEVGIDVGAHIMSELMTEMLKLRPDFKVSKTLLEISKAGYKGRKNKKGFYKYDENGKKVSGQVDSQIYSYYGEIHVRNSMQQTSPLWICHVE